MKQNVSNCEELEEETLTQKIRATHNREMIFRMVLVVLVCLLFVWAASGQVLTDTIISNTGKQIPVEIVRVSSKEIMYISQPGSTDVTRLDLAGVRSHMTSDW